MVNSGLTTVNLGLVGLGGVGRFHLRNAMRLKNARLVAVADTQERARGVAKAMGVKKVYEDYSRLMADSEIDSVVIALPTFLHQECAVDAAEHGKNILLEKPLARNLAEGGEIVAKTSKAGVKIMVGYPLRFSKFATIKSEIDSGHLGEVVVAHATNVWHGPFFPAMNVSSPPPIPQWWLDPELTGGGALLDLGSHMINLLLWYFEDELAAVQSYLGYRFNMPMEDHALCLIRFKSGVSASVNVGWFAQRKSISMEVFGTSETVSMNVDRQRKITHALNLLGLKPTEEEQAFHNELEYFVNCILNDISPEPSAADAFRDLEVISKAYENSIHFTKSRVKTK